MEIQEAVDFGARVGVLKRVNREWPNRLHGLISNGPIERTQHPLHAPALLDV